MPAHERADVEHIKRYGRAQAYSDAIWDRWRRDYLPSLNSRSKWSAQPDRDLKTDDLVWIVEPTSPRGHFLLALVVKLNYGTDLVAETHNRKPCSTRCQTRTRSPVSRFSQSTLQKNVLEKGFF